MILGLRPLVVLATSLASTQMVTAGIPTKSNSTPCKEILPNLSAPSEWIFLTRLKANDPSLPMRSASGSAITRYFNINCQFDVYFGLNPFGGFYQVDQRFDCDKPMEGHFKIAYEGATSRYRGYALDTIGGGQGKCDTFGGDFNIDAGKVKYVTVYQKIQQPSGQANSNSDPSGGSQK